MQEKKRSIIQAQAKVLAIANHSAMGVALGLVFVLILTSTPFFGVLPFVNHSADPRLTMAAFVGTVVVMFGLGAALTGLVLMMEEK